MSKLVVGKSIIKSFDTTALETIFEPDLDIMIGKKEKLVKFISKFLRIFQILKGLTSSGGYVKIVDDYHNMLIAEYKEYDLMVLSKNDLTKLIAYNIESQIVKLSAKDRKKLDALFGRYKELCKKKEKSKLMNIILKTCKNLMKYSEYFIKSDPSFLTIHRDEKAEVFPDLDINFKEMYITNASERVIIYEILKKIKDTSFEIYEIMCKTDSDPRHASLFIGAMTDLLEKKFPRCKKAIARIRESANTLTSNFDKYNKEAVLCGGSTVAFMESFVADVKGDDNNNSIKLEFTILLQGVQKLFINSHTDATDNLLKTIMQLNDSEKKE